MKKILLVGLLLALLCSAVSVSAAQEVTVLLNGEKLEFDVPPQIIDDRTLVPLR
ncbi:MAG: stalk domain-containing protein, partial [Clostridia bacterium]|nr:stalk domain-containing protein [Clostridia bacterium]